MNTSSDFYAYPLIDFREADPPFPELLSKYERVGLRPIVRDITSDIGICCAIAALADDSVPGFPQAHCGLGAHPNARIAVTRALTELAQSRAVDIQGAREDIAAPDEVVHPSARHMQRIREIDPRSWLLRSQGNLCPFHELSSHENDDIADDIRLILSCLARVAIERVLVIDMTEPGGFAVVRVMVPGLEYWGLDHGKIGSRALQFWRRYVQ